jgi:hypothetical protein
MGSGRAAAATTRSSLCSTFCSPSRPCCRGLSSFSAREALLLADADLGGKVPKGVAPVLGLLLGDPLLAGDAVAALRRYSLVTPVGDGMVLVQRLVQAVTLDQAKLPRGGKRLPCLSKP